MLLKPVMYGVTDHGELEATSLTDDDHAQYPLIDSNRGLAGNQLFVTANAYYEEVDGVVKFYVGGTLRSQWDV